MDNREEKNTRRRKPDWSKYDGSSRVSLFEAVALSCDIEPSDIDPERDRDDPELRVFWERLAQTMQAVERGLLRLD
jgi:hypothetical protein